MGVGGEAEEDEVDREVEKGDLASGGTSEFEALVGVNQLHPPCFFFSSLSPIYELSPVSFFWFPYFCGARSCKDLQSMVALPM